MAEELTAAEVMRQIDVQLSHVWMVRTFLKHSDEADEDEELRGVHRVFYDYLLALGGPLQAGDASLYVKTASKKFSKLRKAVELFVEIQPEVSTHTNFQMAMTSVRAAVAEIAAVLDSAKAAGLLAPGGKSAGTPADSAEETPENGADPEE